MTPEEIKKIAEEYADSFGSDSDYRNDPCYGGHIAEAEDVLEFLTARYYLVEKGKAKEEYEWYAGNLNWSESTANEDVAESFHNLFGPDIRKEEEE